jgi:hypothetical protein
MSFWESQINFADRVVKRRFVLLSQSREFLITFIVSSFVCAKSKSSIILFIIENGILKYLNFQIVFRKNRQCFP